MALYLTKQRSDTSLSHQLKSTYLFADLGWDDDDDEPVPLPNVNGAIMRKVNQTGADLASILVSRVAKLI